MENHLDFLAAYGSVLVTKVLTSQDVLSDRKLVVQYNLWRYKNLPVMSSV